MKELFMKQTEIASPTTTDITVLAQQLVTQVRSICAQIPGFTLPHITQPDLRGPASTVPAAAIDAAVSATLAHKALAEAVDAEEVQADEQFTRVFADLHDELKIAFTGIDYTIRLKRFNAGEAALNVLSIARRLAQKPENAHLNAHIEAIEKALRRRRRNSKVAEPPANGPVA
jgi:anti-sigma factor RsiW